MPTYKVAYFSGIGGRSEFMVGQAPAEIEVTVVDPTLSDAEKTELCKDADAIISSDVSLDVLGQCPNLKLVQTLSAGYDRLDLSAILEMGIPVANNGGANAIAVAEHSIALMINVGKRLMLQWDSTTKRRDWRGGLYLADLQELTDKTVGIVGLGRIGKHVAKRLTGFDTHTIFYDIEDIPEDVQKELKVEPAEFDDLLRESDIVSMHVPLTRRTRGMMSDREFDIMKESAILINACRGPVVDEDALYRALQEGKIAAAGLDVLEAEPTPADNPLLDLDNVVVTPHMAGQSQETNLRAATFAYGNIMRVLGGAEAESLVYPE
jgi:phosphoglycerate dehydrogenase-like enzyme